MNRFYVYCYFDDDRKPFYIGKGTGERAYYHHTGVKAPSRDKIILLKENLSEAEALIYEKYLVEIIGRKDLGKGPLLNKCDGGGGTRGHKAKPKTDEIKKRISDSNKRTKSKGVSEETRRKMSEAAKRRCTPEWREGRRKFMQKLNANHPGRPKAIQDPITGRFIKQNK